MRINDCIVLVKHKDLYNCKMHITIIIILLPTYYRLANDIFCYNDGVMFLYGHLYVLETELRYSKFHEGG